MRASVHLRARSRGTWLSIALALSLVVLVGPQPASATFPGSNGRIAFYYYSPAHAKESINTIQPDGSGLHQLTPSTDRNRELPAWSPNGARIAYAVPRSHHRSTVAIMNASGGGRTTVVDPLPKGHQSFIENVDWSPDGTALLFSADGAAGSAIFSVNADGSSLQKITTGTHQDIQGVWAPDGSRIAAISARHGTLVLMNPDGTHRTTVFDMGGNVRFPSWSPDSATILFSWVKPGQRLFDVYEIGRDGTGLRQLTDTPRRSEFVPVFSPNGRRIAFSRSQSKSIISADDLWVMHPDGSNPHAITHTRVRDEFWPTWQPT